MTVGKVAGKGFLIEGAGLEDPNVLPSGKSAAKTGDRSIGLAESHAFLLSL